MKVVLSVTEASMFDNVSNTVNIRKNIKKPFLLLGRGIADFENEEGDIDCLDLANFGKSISRRHATISFPLMCFREKINLIPSYYKKFGEEWKNLTNQLLMLIRDFAKPENKIKISNAKSKFGLYCKVTSKKLVEGDNLQFGNFNFYIKTSGKLQNKNSFFDFLKEENHNEQGSNARKILGYVQENQPVAFLKAYYKNNQQIEIIYFLGQNNCQFTIGRLGTCDLQINRSQLSRKQGIISYNSKESIWVYNDGVLKKKSTNGSWAKTELIKKPLKQFENQEKFQFKIGQVCLELKADYQEYTETQNILDALNSDDDFTNS